MTRMQKNEIYDEISGLLTDYEQAVEETLGAFTPDEALDFEKEFFSMLVKIQNNWEELTGDDED